MTSSYVFNHTRQAFLASTLRIANTRWTRLRGLIGEPSSRFRSGNALWIVPSRGVHTWFMSMPIDLVYLDDKLSVIHVEENVGPWRFAPMITHAASVLELPTYTIYETGTKVGDALEISWEGAATEPKAAAS